MTASTPRIRGGSDELAFVKLRYKLPGESTSRLIDQPIRAADTLAKVNDAHAEQRFAVAVAAFAQRLRGESAVEGFTYADIAELANSARGADPEGYRAEFVRLVRDGGDAGRRRAALKALTKNLPTVATSSRPTNGR